MYQSSPPLRTQINRILKQAEDEAAKKCPDCGDKMVNGKCSCGYVAGGGGEKKKESMGTAGGGYDTSGVGGGMDVMASVEVEQAEKLAHILRYAADNFYGIVDDRSPAEKLAELQAFASTAQKIAAGELSAGESDASSMGLMSNTLGNDGLQKKEQVEPSRGKKMIPGKTSVNAMGELETNMNDDRTGEEWTDNPLKSKRASALYRVLQKHAQDPAQMGAPPAAAPPAGPPPGAPPAAPPQMAPQMAPPGPPPGPDPMMIAQQLMQQGALTPEALAQAAGIAPEEAAAVIAQMTGGTGAPQPAPMQAPPAGGAAMAGGAGQGAAAQPPPPGGAPGMAVQASASPAALFQSALRKVAGEDVSRANISAPRQDKRPEDEGISTPNLPGSQGLASNEAAIAFKAQEGRRPRDEAIGSLLSASVPYKAESGKNTGGYKADSMLGSKTSSLKAATARSYLQGLKARNNRPS